MKRFIASLVLMVGCTTPDDSTKEATTLGAPHDAGADASATMCQNYPLKRAWFGDLHAHTSYSLDAYSFATRNDPFDAYAFARGEKRLTIASGMPDGSTGPDAGITRPLDFLALTDHSEWLAATYGCIGDTGHTLDAGICKLMQSPNPGSWSKAWSDRKSEMLELCPPDGFESTGRCEPEFQSAWQKEQHAAEMANDPCNFTSFVGFEWTYSVGGTLHKNVVFRTGQVTELPLDSTEYPSEQALWSGLEANCKGDAGCEAMTIPHNSNLSNGLAFSVPDGGEAMAAKYQKLVEVMQHKGSSECYYDADAGTKETECNFEYAGDRSGNTNQPQSYVRYGLLQGLAQRALGVINPLKLGFVAATDDHNGTPGNVNESTWPGHGGKNDDTAALRLVPNTLGDRYYKNPGGLAVAWAEQNTRDSIFAAFQRRETYGTSGTRIQVRFYQTWNSTDYCSDSNFPSEIVSAGGIPMGGTFSAGSGAPRFVAYAWKDANDLSRIDIIKLWVDASGGTHEKLFHNPIPGAAGCVTWQDPSFDATLPALYYARVLEVASPRWSAYDCATDPTAAPAQCADGGALNTTIQERAWTSPIWFNP